jgi:flavin-binding protein dodecin
MGAAAATPDILSAIARLLQDEDADVQQAAVEAYRTMMQLGVRLFQKGREWEVKWVTELAETG